MDNLCEIENSGRRDSHCRRKMDMHKTWSSIFPSETLDRLCVCVMNIPGDTRGLWVELTLRLHVTYDRMRPPILTKTDQPHCWRETAPEYEAAEPC